VLVVVAVRVGLVLGQMETMVLIQYLAQLLLPVVVEVAVNRMAVP
jgi:hypothetical protein